MTVLAHGIVGRADLPIPEMWFGVAAAAALAVSFALLAAGWTRPRLEEARERPLLVRLPLAVDMVLGALGVAVFAAVVYAGLAGTHLESENLAPAVVYVLMWVGVPLASVVFGDVFRLLSPWRAVGRAAAALMRRTGETEALPYPARLGCWPAVGGLLLFAFAELCWGKGTDPQTLAICALVYFAAQCVGMGLYGVEAWSRNGDALGVYFGLFASLAAVGRRAGGALVLRPPLAGAPRLGRPAGTVALVCVALGSTVFDGAREGPLNPTVSDLQNALFDLGLSKGAALEWASLLLMLACIGFVAAVYLLGIAAMPAHEHRTRAFVHALVPIVFAYVLAHYFSLLAYQGQSVWWLASDPLGDGSDLFGTAGGSIDYGVVSATAIWWVQVVSLVAGHVAALILAHDRALALYGSAREAVRSQFAMFVLMVAFTCLGLWLLSVANA